VPAKRSAPPRARAAVVALPRKSRVTLPSSRSLVVGLGVLALAAGAYIAARETSVFAVRTIDVAGGPPAVRAQVRRALAPLVGTSLLALDGAALERRVESLPTVVSATYDRAFPHALRVTIVPEQTVAVLHRARDTWLVSARGRVIVRIPARTRPLLPRIWVPAPTQAAAGAFLPADAGGIAAETLSLAAHFPARIATVTLQHGELAFQLRSGVELRFGDPSDMRLKLAIARRALPLLPPGATYLDVSVPGRPVAGADSKLSGRG
jgi:cell division protein FtsQ